jgi:hypothetical protein
MYSRIPIRGTFDRPKKCPTSQTDRNMFDMRSLPHYRRSNTGMSRSHILLCITMLQKLNSDSEESAIDVPPFLDQLTIYNNESDFFIGIPSRPRCIKPSIIPIFFQHMDFRKLSGHYSKTCAQISNYIEIYQYFPKAT